MLIDKQTRLDAVNSKSSFILQAPAGSGKTSLLVDRFVNLLQFCEDPKECLAITFTKKAAFEMRHRVLIQLEQKINDLKNNLKLNHIYYQVLANPNKLQILTIDAFCASLAQKMPILSKFGLNLIIEENPEQLYQEAVDRSLTTVELSEAKIKLFKYFANDYELIKKLFVAMLFKREQWLPLIVPVKITHDIYQVEKKTSNNLQEVLEKNLQQAVEDILSDIFNYLPTQDEQNKILYFAKYAANNINDVKSNINYCKNLTSSWPLPDCLNLPMWRGLTELLLNKNGEPRSRVSINQGFLASSSIKDPHAKRLASQLKNDMHELLKSLKERHRVFLLKLQQIIGLPELQYKTENWEILQNLFLLLPELVAYLMLVFEEKQTVDFTQIAIAALEAMGDDNDPTDLALILDHKINHILVDEFQDTSVLQFNLLEKLIVNWDGFDGRTIFLVGDPMQSIYRFRQANVGLFLKVQKNGIGNVKLKNLYLTTNFRSSKSIINNLNYLFSKIFPPENDIIYGGVSYTEVTYYEKNNLNNNDQDINFMFAEDPLQEATNIVELINNIKQHNPTISIAVLVRAKSHASLILRELRENSVPYQANDIESLANQPVVCDLIALTRAVLHVNDTVAWLSILRGPLVGLKLIDLHALAYGFNDNNNNNKNCNLLFKNLQQYKKNSQLSFDAIVRLDYVLPILFLAVEQKEIENLSILIKKTWLSLGGDLLLSPIELNLAEDFFHKLLTIKNIFKIDCLENLIHKYFIKSHAAEINLNNIQIMTIHKAKGLEFDVVIVPGMNKSLKSFDNSLFLWEERSNLLNNYLLIAPIKSASQSNNSIYNFIRTSEEQRELNESKRLLYVAITRAKKKFYGFNCNRTSRSNSFLRFVEPYVNKNKELIKTTKIMVNNIKKSVILKRIPKEWYINKIKYN